jgi:hypothetical protein
MHAHVGQGIMKTGGAGCGVLVLARGAVWVADGEAAGMSIRAVLVILDMFGVALSLLAMPTYCCRVLWLSIATAASDIV